MNAQIIKLFVLISLLSVIIFSGCGDSEPTTPGEVPEGTRVLVANSLGETISQFTYSSGSYATQSNVAATGQAPNQLLVSGSVLFVLNSLSNSILALDVETFGVLFEASVGTGKSPYNMAMIDSDEMLVSNWLANDCVRLDVSQTFSGDNRVIATIPMPSGINLPKSTGVTSTVAAPQAIVVDDSTAYVTLANLNSDTFVAGGPGLVAIINLNSNQLQSTFQTMGKNTVGLARDPFREERLYILSSGDMNSSTWEYEGNGVIDVFNMSTKGITKSINIDGAPSEMVVTPTGIAYVTDAMAGRILTFSTYTYAMGPIVELSSGSGKSYASGIAIGPNYLVYALEFNSDRLIAIDTYSNNTIVSRLSTGDGPDAIVVVR